MTEKKKSFILYLDYKEQFSMLSNEQAGQLIKGILEYADTSVVPTLPMELAIAFSFIRSTMDRDAEKWNKTRTQRAEAGRKGGNATASKREAHKQQEATSTEDCVWNQQTELEAISPVSETMLFSDALVEEIQPKAPQQPTAKKTTLELAEKVWCAFPKRNNKPAVLDWFMENTPSAAQVDQMLEAIREQSQSYQWTKENGQYIPSPLKWLTSMGWEDKLPGLYTSKSANHSDNASFLDMTTIEQMIANQFSSSFFEPVNTNHSAGTVYC